MRSKPYLLFVCDVTTEKNLLINIEVEKILIMKLLDILFDLIYFYFHS